MFIKWLKDNGAIFNSLDYPVAFGTNELVGVCATREIGPDEAYLFLPGKLLICEAMIMDSVLGPIITRHPAVFKEHHDQEYLILIFFIMFEMQKGEESFWYPYFNIT